MERLDNDTFAIAYSKEKLKQLTKSRAPDVQDRQQNNLFLNENGTEKDGIKKLVAVLVASSKARGNWLQTRLTL